MKLRKRMIPPSWIADLAARYQHLHQLEIVVRNLIRITRPPMRLVRRRMRESQQ